VKQRVADTASGLVERGRRAAERITYGQAAALGRLAGVSVAVAAARGGESGELRDSAFDLVVVLAAIYAVGTLVLELLRARDRPDWALAAVDMAFLTALTATSGGAASELHRGFWAIPVVASFRSAPSRTGAWGLLAAAAYTAAGLIYAATHDPDRLGELREPLVYIGLFTIISMVLSERQRRSTGLARRQTALVADSLQAEARERRRIAEALHDGVLQTLLAIRQDLDQAAKGGPFDAAFAQEATVEAISELRATVSVLHPQVIEHSGLGAALDAVAEQQAGRGHFEVSVSVAPEAVGFHDQLLLALAREALTNVAKHSGATEASVTLSVSGSDIVLEVCDNGRGFHWDRQHGAVGEGHIGLASSAARVAAVGGAMDVEAAPGRTVVRFRVPGKLSSEEELQRSSEIFGALVESVREYAIFGLDPAGRVISWNAGAERITGYREDEIVGRHFSVFYDSEDVDGGHAEQALVTALLEGSHAEEGWRVRKDGSRYWSSIAITPLRTRGGKLLGYAKVTRDLTDQQQTEAQLKIQEISREMSDGVVITRGDDGVIVYTNQWFDEMTGHRPGDLLGRQASTLVATAEEYEALAKKVGRAVDAAGIWRGELEFARADGTTFRTAGVVNAYDHSRFGPVWTWRLAAGDRQGAVAPL
jgi:two-component system, NarL family, sensor kinase